MEGVQESMEEVWFAIKVWSCLLAEGIDQVTKLSKTDYEILKVLELPICAKVSKLTLLVSWRKPDAGWVKFNDLHCVGNAGPSGGGGVIRDHQGNMVTGFFASYGHGRNNEAELQGIIAGVELSKELGFLHV